MPLITPPIKNISEVTELLKEQILKGTRRSRLFRRSQECPFDRGYEGMAGGFWVQRCNKRCDINAILRELVMSKVSCESLA